VDNGVPPTEQRTGARAPGTAKSRAAQPTDPRHESAAPTRSRAAKGTTANGSNGAKSQSARGAGKKGAAARTRSHTQPTAEPKPVELPSADAAVALADIPTLGVAPMPLLLPPIVPAQEETTEPRSNGNGNGNGNGSTRTLAPWPVVAPSTEPAALADPATYGDAKDAGTALVPSVRVPSDTATTTLPALVPSPAPEFTDTDGTDGLPSLLKPRKPPRALRAPVVRQRRRPRVRRVTRVVRHVDTWSVFKVALVFNLFLYAVCLTAGVMLWQVAQNTGTVDNIERFFESFGWERFELKGGEIYHNAWIAGLFVVVGLTGLAVLAATLFNLITDLVGGVRVTVLEEEVIARDDRGLGWRRASRAKAAEPAEPEAAPNPVE